MLRKDGLWLARLDMGRDENGKRRIWQVAGKDRERVQEELEEQLRWREREREIAIGRQLVGDFLDAWLESLRRRKTVKAHATYKEIIDVLIKPAIGSFTLGELRKRHVQEMLDTLSGQNASSESPVAPISTRTRQDIRVILRSALDPEVSWHMPDFRPASRVAVANPPEDPANGLSVEEAKRLLEVIKGHPLEAFYTVALACRLHLTEALGLRWDDVDFTKKQLVVQVALETVNFERRLKDLKAPRRGETIALPQFAFKALKERRRIQRDDQLKADIAWNNPMNLVFTTTMGTSLMQWRVQKQWQAFLRQAQLPPMPFYVSRQTRASLLAAQGAR